MCKGQGVGGVSMNDPKGISFFERKVQSRLRWWSRSGHPEQSHWWFQEREHPGGLVVWALQFHSHIWFLVGEFRSHKESQAQLSKEGGSFTPRHLMREPCPIHSVPQWWRWTMSSQLLKKRDLLPRKKENHWKKKKMVWSLEKVIWSHKKVILKELSSRKAKKTKVSSSLKS